MADVNTTAASSSATGASEGPSSLELDAKIYNKVEHNYHLSNKKNLFLNMRKFY